jgi:phosphoribosylamine---glycine ligase
VMASGGYPGSYAKGKTIHGLAEAAKLPNVKVFHAGTAVAASRQSAANLYQEERRRSAEAPLRPVEENQIVTNGGRVLGVTALGRDLKSAQAAAYVAVETIHFEGAQFRRDIAAKAL